jgi:TonB family protein
MKGPIGKIGPRPAPVEQNVAKAAAPSGPRFVPVQSLARKPAPPGGLGAMLERNFPRRARLQGVEGKAQVRFRVLPSGKPTGFRIIDESPQGFDFGTACVATLREAPPWQAPLDRAGVAVETEINFSCSFEVAY